MYYHVGFAFDGGSTLEKRRKINDALTKFTADWMRYSNSCWIVYAESADKVHIAVREEIGDKDQFVVLPLDMSAHRQGLLSSWIWDWLNIDRTSPGWVEKVAAIRNALKPPPAPPPELPSGLLPYLLSLTPPKDE
jgi:hypothetical protein